ncbi:MAG: SDR family NAD(P)-dependent oxidoreductase [Clostridium sp.]
MRKLENKVALVTSGTRGIGLQCVKTLAENGATVYIGARRLEAAQEISRELGELGLVVKGVYFDATKEETYETMVNEVVKEAGKIDILVNNYGGTDSVKDRDLVSGDTDTFFNTINSNLKSVYLPCKAVVPHMVSNGGGSIINISSIGSIVPDLGRIGYCVSKAGVNSLTENIAVQYAKDNIRCNAVLPGLIATDAALNNMTQGFIDGFLRHVPLGRFGQPSDIANAVLFLASDDSSFITGNIMPVAGGFSQPSPLYAEGVKK